MKDKLDVIWDKAKKPKPEEDELESLNIDEK